MLIIDSVFEGCQKNGLMNRNEIVNQRRYHTQNRSTAATKASNGWDMYCSSAPPAPSHPKAGAGSRNGGAE